VAGNKKGVVAVGGEKLGERNVKKGKGSLKTVFHQKRGEMRQKGSPFVRRG